MENRAFFKGFEQITKTSWPDSLVLWKDLSKALPIQIVRVIEARGYDQGLKMGRLAMQLANLDEHLGIGQAGH